MDYEGEGFKPVHTFQSWRLAILNYDAVVEKNNFRKMERHMLTDEIFILQKGMACLILANSEASVSKVDIVSMKPNEIYNVPQNIWHHVLLSKEARVLIIENSDTGSKNTEYVEIDDLIKDDIMLKASF